MVWELLEKMKQIYNLYEQRQPLRGGGNHQNCHGNLKVLCWSKGESQEKAGCAELEVLPWVGWVGDGLTADLPCPELFSSCWVDVVPSQAFSCRGGRLSSDLKAPGMTLYHCALMINQQTNYHSQSRLLGAFLSGGAKAEKGDLVCSEHELFPTLPATR